MKDRIAHAAASIAVAIAFSAISASAASATATLTPASAEFGTYPLGVSSPPKDYKLTVTAGDPFHVTIEITNPDWSQTNNCPAMMGVSMGQSCTISVTFKPIAFGPRGGLISTGSHVAAPPNSNKGPVAEAFGTGLRPADAVVAPTPPASTHGSPVSKAKKKCKKRKIGKASAAKKCKKKKTRK